MRKLKIIFSTLVCILTIITLASCGSKKINQIVPYGNINDSSYATSGDNKITNKQLYDLLRKESVSLINEDIKYNLFNDILALYDSEDKDDVETVNSGIISEIYSASNTDEFKKISDQDKATLIEKYLNNKFNEGIIITENDIKVTIKTVDGEEEFEANFPDELTKAKRFDVGLAKYAKAEIKKIYKEEYIEGKKNKFYISEDDIQAYYHNSGKKYSTSQAFVIKFLSQAQAERVMKKVLNSETINLERTQEEIILDYIKLYNEQYGYRENLNEDSYLDSSYINYVVDRDKNEISAVSSQFASIFSEMENGDAFSKPQKIDESYYLVYKINSPEVIEWENLKTQENFETVKNEMLDYIIDTKNTVTYQQELMNERYETLYENQSLEIYDPVIATLFSQSNSDYEVANKSNSNLVYMFKYDGKEYSLKVDDLFTKLEKLYGMSTATKYLINQFALSTNFVDKVDSDAIKEYTKAFDKEVKTFEKGKTDYKKNIGLTTYLNIKYGYNNREDILKNFYLASKVTTEMLAYYGEHSLDGENFNVNDKLFNNFMEICKDIYENEYKTKFSHMLISVDDEGTGGTVDPDVYIKNLPESKKEDFKQAVLNLSQVIISEAKILTKSKTYTEALEYIVTAFNRNYDVVSTVDDKNDTWNDYKTYNFTLKCEDLGEITYSSSAGYVTSFADTVKEMYEQFKDDDKAIEDKGFLQFSGDEKLTDVDQLCKTNYGFHILNIYSVSKPKSSLFTKESDYQSDKDSEYKQYEHLKIIIEPDDEDDDELPQRFLYADAYSGNDYPSAQQLFIYFYEYLNGGVTSISSSRRTAISALFDQVISRYESAEFKSYRSMLFLDNVSFTNDTDGSKYKKYVSILKRNINGYTTNENYMYNTWFDFDWKVELPK